MAETNVVGGIVGASLALSASLPATYDAAGYGNAAIIYTPISEIEDFGTHGATAEIIKFIPATSGIVKKAKGSVDFGKLSITTGKLPNDAGQKKLDEAMDSPNHYSAKLTFPSGAIHYLDVLVVKAEHANGKAGDILKRAFDLEICLKPVIVPAP